MLTFEGLGIKLFTQQQLENIHLATVKVLEETGIEVHGQEALEIFHGAGCIVDSETSMVKIPQHVLEDAVRSAPSKVLLAARDPRKDLILEEGKTYFSAFGVAVSVIDPVTGELRDSRLEDVANVARLADALDEVARGGGCVTPHDVPEQLRALYSAEAVFCNTSKHAGARGTPEDVRLIMEMAAAMVGGMDKLRERPVVSSGTCPHSPLVLHDNNTEIIIESARVGIPVQVLTMAMAGGTAPVTLAGALVITNAEVLSGIVLAQLVRRGNPVIYGSTTTMLDLLHSTAPTGVPEMALISSGAAQMGKYYKIPTHIGGSWGDSKLSDAQIGHEKTLTAILPAMAGANHIFGMGVMESGMTLGFGQLVMDAEFVRMINRTLRGINVNEETLAVDVIKKVGAGRNYLAEPHTLRLMQKEQSRARLIDRRMRDAWLRKGGTSLAQRADEEALAILESHKPLPLEPSVKATIRDIVHSAEEASERGSIR